MNKIADYITFGVILIIAFYAYKTTDFDNIRNPAPISPELVKGQYTNYKPTSYEINKIHKESLENE